MQKVKFNPNKQFKPNKHIVSVKQPFGWRQYEVDHPENYMKKCRSEGKECIYLGITSNNGILTTKTN